MMGRVAIALCCSGVIAASAQVGPLPGAAVLPIATVGVSGPPTIAWTGNGSSTTAGTTMTASGVAFGTAASNRYIACGILIEENGSTAITVTGVTIGGIAATQVVTVQNNTDSTPSRENASIYIAAVPTGTSGNVVTTYSTTVNSYGVSCYSLTNILSPSPTATNASIATAGSASLTIGAGGVGMGAAYTSTSPSTNPAAAWVNLSEDFDSLIAASNNYSSASHTGAQSNTVTVTWTNAFPTRSAMVLAAFQ